MATWIFALSGAYLLGSVNFAILLFKVLGKEDPRMRSSGNPGITNVYRQAGIFIAAAVLLLDLGRAVLVAFLGVRFFPVAQVSWLGCALIAGNRFPCFHGFRGGKGVANFLGFTLGLVPPWAGLAVLVWLAVRAITKISFIPSFAMVGILAAGCIKAGDGSMPAVAATLITCGLIIAGHRKNIEEFRNQRKVSSA